MNDRVIDRATLDFLLYDWLALDALASRPVFNHDRATIDAVLDLAEELAQKELLPHFSLSDRQEPLLDLQGEVRIPDQVAAALANICKTGITSAGFSPELGGMGLPATACAAALGILQAAVIATPSFLMLTVANSRLIVNFGTAAQIEAFARPQIEGRWFGTMCLSEAQAGSSLADITTRAVPDGQDTLGVRYRLHGSKMWISGGDHQAGENIVHLVLAKTRGSDGKLDASTQSLSLFVVPKILPDGARNDVGVVGLNHKLGYRGLPNCLLDFGGGRFTPRGHSGAIGWRIGELGQGLPLMFQMMNEARINVGLGSVMVGYRAYLLALAYSAERIQGRTLGVRDGAPVAIINHPDVKRMLLAQKSYSEGGLALVLYAARLVDNRRSADTPAARAEAAQLLDLLTPVIKVWPSEWGQVTNDLAIQIFGGAGYTRDVPVEQLYRDQRLNQIHEGTTGIQALDLLGRKLLRDHGEAYALLVRRVDATIAKAREFPTLEAIAHRLAVAWQAMAEAVKVLLACEDASAVLGQATPFLWAMGHAVVGWIWLDITTAALRDKDPARTPFTMGKLRACQYFMEAELPKIHAWLTYCTSLTDVAAAMTAAQF